MQKNEQPSWTLTNARVRSTEARPSAIPSIGDAPTGSTPDSVGSARATSAGAAAPAAAASAGPSSASSSASRASFARLSTSRAAGSAAANASRPTWTEQPVTTISASGLARRAARTACRDFASASIVTVQVLTRTRSARCRASTTVMPRSRSRRAAPSISAWLTLQPRFAIAAVRIGAAGAGRDGARRHHSCGFVLIRKPIVPTSAAIA